MTLPAARTSYKPRKKADKKAIPVSEVIGLGRGAKTTPKTEMTRIPIEELADHIDPNKPLTEKAKLFARYWAQGESITSASARAGYQDGGSFAYRLTRYPQVIALYNAEKAKYEEACQMTRKRVMEGLLDGIEMAKLEGTSLGVIAGWREIGKMCGYYEPVTRKVDITISGNVQMDRLNKLSDAELLALITPALAAEPKLLEFVTETTEDDA